MRPLFKWFSPIPPEKILINSWLHLHNQLLRPIWILCHVGQICERCPFINYTIFLVELLPFIKFIEKDILRHLIARKPVTCFVTDFKNAEADAIPRIVRVQLKKIGQCAPRIIFCQ